MHALLPQVLFYTFATLAVISAFFVVTQSNPVRCVLFLVFTFFCTAILWLIAQAEFLALILVLVYVGAVMTLFLFVVMMLDIEIESLKKNWLRYLPVGLILLALLVGLLISALPTNGFQKATEVHTELTASAQTISNTEALGLVLYTDYVFAFEMAAVILLVAIISAIALVHRQPHQSKRQNILKQIMTRKQDRIKLLHMKSGKQP